MKYFIYARKSTEGDDKQIASIGDQIAEATQIAESHGLEVLDVVSESKSAKAPGREKFNQMLTRINRGEAQGIICWKLNRLARNPIDAGQIGWMLQTGIIQHIRTTDSEFVPTDNVLLMQFEFGIANQYVRDLSIDVQRGMRRKAERGWYPATKLPIGYRHNPEKALSATKPEIIRDTRNFELVKKVWKLMVTGKYSIMDIKRKGDALGLSYRGGCPFSKQGYAHMFRNEFYCGYFFWKDKDGQRIRIRGNHPAIVTPYEFEKIQTILFGRTNHSKLKRYYFPYKTLIKCGECKGNVTAENKLQAICTGCKHKFSIKTKSKCPRCNLDVSEMRGPSIIDKTYYHCTKNNGACSQGSILLEQIEKTLLEQLKSHKVNKDISKWIIEQLEIVSHSQDDQKELLRKLKKSRSEIQNKIKELIHMRANGEINIDELQLAKSDSEKSLITLNEEIATLDDTSVNWKKVAKEYLRFLDVAAKNFKKAEESERNKIVENFASNLVLKDKKLYITTQEAIQYINDCAALYETKNRCFEPEIPYGNKHLNSPFWTPFILLLAVLNLNRTSLLDDDINNDGTDELKLAS